jgi:hypothetical protein
VELQRNSNGIAAAITDDLLRAAGGNDLAFIAGQLGLDPVGSDMERITGLSAAALSRANRGQSRTRRWRHLATLAALVRELLALMKDATGSPELDPAAARSWLYGGRVVLAGVSHRPVDVLADEELAVALLAELRMGSDGGGS